MKKTLIAFLAFSSITLGACGNEEEKEEKPKSEVPSTNKEDATNKKDVKEEDNKKAEEAKDSASEENTLSKQDLLTAYENIPVFLNEKEKNNEKNENVSSDQKLSEEQIKINKVSSFFEEYKKLIDDVSEKVEANLSEEDKKSFYQEMDKFKMDSLNKAEATKISKKELPEAELAYYNSLKDDYSKKALELINKFGK